MPPGDPHAFVLGTGSPLASVRAVAVAAQTRIADFLAGASLPEEDGLTAPYFEIPIKPPLPVESNFVVP